MAIATSPYTEKTDEQRAITEMVRQFVANKLDDGKWERKGQKMWVTNGLMSGVVFVLMKDDPKADPPYKGMTCFITEKEPGAAENEGLAIPPKIKKMGYKGVESTELVYDGFVCPPERVLGGEEAGVGN